MITLEPSANPEEPSSSTTDLNAAGGMARWKSRLGIPPIAVSASRTAETNGAESSGSAAPNERALSNVFHTLSFGLREPELRNSHRKRAS